jgi:hypothetical protein
MNKNIKPCDNYPQLSAGQYAVSYNASSNHWFGYAVNKSGQTFMIWSGYKSRSSAVRALKSVANA